MKTGNTVPAASARHGVRVRDDSQLRDIEELIAKLQLVTRQLSYPARQASSQGQKRPGELRSEHTDSEVT